MENLFSKGVNMFLETSFNIHKKNTGKKYQTFLTSSKTWNKYIP